MICKNCNTEISDNENFCSNCGLALNSYNNINNVKNSYDNPSHFAGVVACCFPIVGFILYFLWRDEKPESSKLICNWMIGGVLMYFVFFFISLMFGFLGI